MTCYNTEMLAAHERSEYAESCRAEREAQEFLDEQLEAFKEWFAEYFDGDTLAYALAEKMRAEKPIAYSHSELAGELRALDILAEEKFNSLYRKSSAVVISKRFCDDAVVMWWVHNMCPINDNLERREIVESIMHEMGFYYDAA